MTLQRFQTLTSKTPPTRCGACQRVPFGRGNRVGTCLTLARASSAVHPRSHQVGFVTSRRVIAFPDCHAAARRHIVPLPVDS